MNGDFLSLLPRSPFSALGTTDTDLIPLEATTVFAFHWGDGVLIAGDHRATAGNVIFSDRTEKIVDLDHRSLIAIAGSPAVAFEMARTLQTTFEFYRRSQLQPMSLPAKIRSLSRLLHENLPATLQGIGMVAPIFAGIEEEAKRPMIFFYDPLGAQFEAASFAGSGSGSGSIKSILHYLEEWGNPKPNDLDLAGAVVLASRLLMTAAEFDTATGGVNPENGLFATIKVLTADGVRSIGADEQKSFWESGTP